MNPFSTSSPNLVFRPNTVYKLLICNPTTPSAVQYLTKSPRLPPHSPSVPTPLNLLHRSTAPSTLLPPDISSLQNRVPALKMASHPPNAPQDLKPTQWETLYKQRGIGALERAVRHVWEKCKSGKREFLDTRVRALDDFLSAKVALGRVLLKLIAELPTDLQPE